MQWAQKKDLPTRSWNVGALRKEYVPPPMLTVDKTFLKNLVLPATSVVEKMVSFVKADVPSGAQADTSVDDPIETYAPASNMAMSKAPTASWARMSSLVGRSGPSNTTASDTATSHRQ